MLEPGTIHLLRTLEQYLPPVGMPTPAPPRDMISHVTWLGFPDSHTTAEIDRGDASKMNGYARMVTTWFGFAGVGTSVDVSTVGSDSDYFLTVFADYGAGLEFVACNDGSRRSQAKCEFFAISGVSYYFRAQGFAGPRGRLTMSTSEPARYPAQPFRFGFSIDSIGGVNPRTGLVTLTGKIDTSAAAKYTIDITLSQSIGALEIHAYGVASFGRDASGLGVWSIRLRAWDGFFMPGMALVSGYAEGCGAGLRDFWSELIEPFAIELRDSI